MDVVNVGMLPTGRPSVLNVWYPAGVCSSDEQRLCLAESTDLSKVAVLSHGSMGSARDYAWLPEVLAGAGIVTIGINHYGESRVYAERDHSSASQVWQRPLDISAVLDHLGKTDLFQKRLDWRNVVAIGHSVGGHTAALLAGARFDLDQVAAHCESPSAAADRSCHYGRNRREAPPPVRSAFSASYVDRRIRKLVLLDPALGSGLVQGSVKTLALPTMIVGAAENDFLPWASHGARYADAMPGARTVVLDGGEGHFVFLSPCRHDTEVAGVPLCRDRPEVDRALVQARLAGIIATFVSLNDEAKESVP